MDDPAAGQSDAGQSSADNSAAERPGTDRPGTDRPDTDRPDTDRPDTDQLGTDQLGTRPDRHGSREQHAGQPAIREPAAHNNVGAGTDRHRIPDVESVRAAAARHRAGLGRTGQDRVSTGNSRVHDEPRPVATRESNLTKDQLITVYGESAGTPRGEAAIRLRMPLIATNAIDLTLGKGDSQKG
jgi:hypothetical protein